ncbi:hypothetical protein SLS60_000167 [Paraconiothyrium brasiliense]|uniref:Uncharacterized protein n=1 Tax=Paraconiothyrium brasiliense TaxID=300254 RepID=A0ABR3S5H3_9PLEO
MEPVASPNVEMISERSYTPSNKSSQSLITACESSELSDADSLEYQKYQADLDLRTAHVQEQWRAFRAGLQEGMTEAKREQLLNDRCEDDSINPKHLNLEGMDLKEEGVYELEATESQTTGKRGAYELEVAKTQNDGNNAPESVFSAERTPLVGTLPADVEIFQTQHEAFVPTITNDEIVGPAYSLVIMLVLVYLSFEVASSIAQALASYLSLVK